MLLVLFTHATLFGFGCGFVSNLSFFIASLETTLVQMQESVILHTRPLPVSHFVTLKTKFGAILVTRLRSLTMRFNSYVKQNDQSNMIRELKLAGSNLIDEQQVQAMICPLHISGEHM